MTNSNDQRSTLIFIQNQIIMNVLSVNNIKKQDLIISYLIPTSQTTFIVAQPHIPLPGVYAKNIFAERYIFNSYHGFITPQIYHYLPNPSANISYTLSRRFVIAYASTDENLKVTPKEYYIHAPYSPEAIKQSTKINVTPIVIEKSDALLHRIDHQVSFIIELVYISWLMNINLKTILAQTLLDLNIKADLDSIVSAIDVSSLSVQHANERFIQNFFSEINNKLSRVIKSESLVKYDTKYTNIFTTIPYFKHISDSSTNNITTIPVIKPSDQNAAYEPYIKSVLSVILTYNVKQLYALITNTRSSSFDESVQIRYANSFETTVGAYGELVKRHLDAWASVHSFTNNLSSKTVVYKKMNMSTGVQELKTYTSHVLVFKMLSSKNDNSSKFMPTMVQTGPTEQHAMTITDLGKMLRLNFDKYNPKAFNKMNGCLYLNVVGQFVLSDNYKLCMAYEVDKYILQEVSVSRGVRGKYDDEFAIEFFKNGAPKK